MKRRHRDTELVLFENHCRLGSGEGNNAALISISIAGLKVLSHAGRGEGEGERERERDGIKPDS